MITVSKALDQLFALTIPLRSETVPLVEANGRVLATCVKAKRDQPPFASSAMDGYGVMARDVAPGAKFRVIGEAAAGHSFARQVGRGEAVRIFTGAPVPEGVSRVIIQEDVTRDADTIIVNDKLDKGFHIRPLGGDFKVGEQINAPRILRPADIALLASMNIADVPVIKKPIVAILATGDELVMPGECPGPDQIIASNSFGLQAMLRDLGAEARLLPIAHDNRASLKMAFSLAGDADLLLSIGGASVGDHDLVGDVANELGMRRSFYKIAMRPGKPLMAGRLSNGATMIGLPGNPVSAMVCGHVFVAPVIRNMLGLGAAATPESTAALSKDIGANGPRQHYMRALLENGALTVLENQDSSLLSVLARANALLIRQPHDPERQAGAVMRYLPI
ncbi:gephyrin-like molybdotransferase Glp [Pseudopelagicola sp. nBUS_20]|uniref:molybdopterin molybdotransferase MoeA n=1 Tax=Pseudopelagicola sp. nBUS_20 TaxID=3395317 RepID=UPI003EBA66A1